VAVVDLDFSGTESECMLQLLTYSTLSYLPSNERGRNPAQVTMVAATAGGDEQW
jgi:hypothetical protein